MDFDRIPAEVLNLKTPARITLSGPSGSGKTEWIRRFLKHHPSIIGKAFDISLFVYGEYQQLFDVIKDENPSMKWCEGFSQELIEKELKNTIGTKLLIVDDLLQEVAKDSFFHSFYVRASHHWNVTVIFTTQNLYHKGLRVVNLNTTHYILFKSLRDKTPVRTLAMQVFPDKWRQLMNIYTHATRYSTDSPPTNIINVKVL